MQPTESSWIKLIDSIEIHRDARARYFKPTCVIAVCNLIDGNVGSIKSIPAYLVVQEFNRLVVNVFPKKAAQGWMPMWHLMRDGAWVCKLNGIPTRREVFPLTKPRSLKETLNAVDSIDCSVQFAQLWESDKARNQLRTIMFTLLLADDDEDANLMGEYLKSLHETSNFDDETFKDSNESNVGPYATENYAKFRVHSRIERSAKIAATVKKLQGYSCLACGFNFKKVYGELGSNYIEAHHVVPVAKRQGTEKRVNLIDDFIVLCANCHKMIHRLGEPWTRERLTDLRAILFDQSGSIS